MRYLSKKSLFLAGISLGSLAISFSSITNGLTIPTEPNADEHKTRLHSLFLGASGNALIKVEEGKKNLTIANGIIAGGLNLGLNSSIAGGSSNSANGVNSVIGGGNTNSANGNNSIVVGGSRNNSAGGGVILGGQGNTSNNGGVIIGGTNNMSNKNNLSMGTNSNGSQNSFAWNASTQTNAARVDATNGILIGTNVAKTGVNLVVSGAVKMAGTEADNGIGGEIRSITGCFFAFDGQRWHIMNKTGSVCNADNTTLTVATKCKFGNLEIQEGDKVWAYSTTFSSNCDADKKQVVCTAGNLVYYKNQTSVITHKYPYCYDAQGISLGGGGSSSLTTYSCQGTVPGNATLVAGSDQNLTANTTRTLYANAAVANGKKCAYLCNADSEYNSVLKMCINKSSYCKATHYECESPAVATNKKATSTGYTWDCAIDGTTVSAGCSEIKTPSGLACGKCGSELYSCSKGVVSNTGYSDNKVIRQCKGTDSTVKCEMEGVLAPQPFCPEDYIMENGTCKLNAKYCGKIKAVGNDGSNINTANYRYTANGICFGEIYTGHLEQADATYGQVFPFHLRNKNNNGSRGPYRSNTDGVWLSEYINNQNKPSQCHDSHHNKRQIMNSQDDRRFKEYGCVLTNYGLGATDDGYTLTCTNVSSTPCFSKPIGGVTVKGTFLSGNSACK